MSPKYIPINYLEEIRTKIIKKTTEMNRSGDVSEINKQRIISVIHMVLDVYQPIMSKLSENNSYFLYRIRINDANKNYTNVQDLYSPPQPTGRSAGNSDAQILYLASALQTCLTEKGAKIGDLVTEAIIDYKEIIDGSFWFVGQLEYFHRSQDLTNYLRDKPSVHNHYYADEEVVSSLIFFDSLINELFSSLSSAENGYFFNQYLIEEIKKTVGGFYGVVFSSTKCDRGINFAVYGDAIAKLKFLSPSLLKITGIDSYGNYIFKWLDRAKIEGDKIIWSK